MANVDSKNFGEINVGEIITLKSSSNYSYVEIKFCSAENYNACVVKCANVFCGSSFSCVKLYGRIRFWEKNCNVNCDVNSTCACTIFISKYNKFIE